MVNIKGHSHFSFKEMKEQGFDLKEALDMRDDRLAPGVLIKCEFCDTMVWLDDKNWEIVTCEDRSCQYEAQRKYCM